MDREWLDGYNFDKLKELYLKDEPIKENTEEQFRSYFEYAKVEYPNFGILKQYENYIKELLVSNYGSIKYNGNIIPSTLIANGPNKGKSSYPDYYREIIFPDLPVKSHIFITYRLVAEVWCNNPDPSIYNHVHHIGNDSYDNKNNLLFMTFNQHFPSFHNKIKKFTDSEKEKGDEIVIDWQK
jgi:hypothetical protein